MLQLCFQRFQMKRLFVLWTLALSCQLGQSYLSNNYDVIADDKTFMENCQGGDNQGNLLLNDIIDVSGLSFTVSEDLETLYVNGDIVVMFDMPKEPIMMELEVLRKERGQWLPTMYNMKRDDFCSALMDPHELWHPFVQKIPQEQRVCPPKAGSIYTMNNITNRIELKNMPRWDINGDLKTVAHFSVGAYKTCMVIYFNIYRK